MGKEHIQTTTTTKKALNLYIKTVAFLTLNKKNTHKTFYFSINNNKTTNLKNKFAFIYIIISINNFFFGRFEEFFVACLGF